MRRLVVFFLLVFVLTVFCERTTPTGYEFQATKDLVNFVDRAAELVEKEGEASFPKFREKSGEWFKGDDYIFIWGMDGMRYVYPPNPRGEGELMVDLKDKNERPIGKMILEEASSTEGYGWVHYQWPKPEGEENFWKSTYVKKVKSPDGKEFIIGSGKYDMKCEPLFVVDLVNDGIDLLEKDGLEAIACFSDKKSKYRFLDSYIFLKDMEANEILNPNNPDLDGKNIMEMTDANGKYFVKEEIEILKNSDDCWMDYVWPKPGEKAPSEKTVYCKKVDVDGRTIVVGAGYYPDNVMSTPEK